MNESHNLKLLLGDFELIRGWLFEDHGLKSSTLFNPKWIPSSIQLSLPLV